MMVVDSSVLVAIILREAGSDDLAAALHSADRAYVAAPTLLETRIVLDGRRIEQADQQLEALLQLVEIEIVAFTAEHAVLAHAAFRDFGKGQHRARLNFGDCMAYALAKSLDAPLLFKGGDFALTDISPAV